MKSASKAVRKMIGEWCGVAYQRELGAELAKLHNQFHQWETGTPSSGLFGFGLAGHGLAD